MMTARGGHWLLGVVILAAAATACRRTRGETADAGAFHALRVGTVVPTYRMPALTGDTIAVGPGQPITVLNVWATWCTSCREEMAALGAIQRDFASRGVRVVAVSVDGSNEARVRRFVEEERLDFTVVHDPAGVVQEQFQVPAVPTTLLVDADGVLRWEHTGNITPVAAEARAALGQAVAASGH